MKKLLCTAAAFALVAGLAFSAQAQVAATATVAVHHHHERHPEIRKAIHSLERTKNDLNHAAHDFGGHRVAAIQHVDAALAELHQALQYDEEHEEHEHH